jgi:hypothetical protein
MMNHFNMPTAFPLTESELIIYKKLLIIAEIAAICCPFGLSSAELK